MEENWLAFYIASQIRCTTVDQAFDLYDQGFVKNFVCKNNVLKEVKLTRKDYLKMLQLRKKGFKRKDVAKLFNITASMLDYHLKKLKINSKTSKNKEKMKNTALGLIPGQISIFDIENIPKDKKQKTVTPIGKTTIEKTVTTTKKPNAEIYAKLTNGQQATLKKFMNETKVSRVILCDKSIEIETNVEGKFNTFWISETGDKDFSVSKVATVLPWYKVLYYLPEFKNKPFTEIQSNKFNAFLEKNQNKIKRIIHRYGDLNILIEISNKIIDILPNGWVLEFKNISCIDCIENEVIKDYMININPSIANIGKLVKTGDLVQAFYGKRIIEGRITREYGLGNEILNIDFKDKNGLATTAIGRKHILKILS